MRFDNDYSLPIDDCCWEDQLIYAKAEGVYEGEINVLRGSSSVQSIPFHHSFLTGFLFWRLHLTPPRKPYFSQIISLAPLPRNGAAYLSPPLPIPPPTNHWAYHHPTRHTLPSSIRPSAHQRMCMLLLLLLLCLHNAGPRSLRIAVASFNCNHVFCCRSHNFFSPSQPGEYHRYNDTEILPSISCIPLSVYG